MFIFGLWNDKPRAGPADLNSRPLGGSHWLRWVVSYCWLIPFIKPILLRNKSLVISLPWIKYMLNICYYFLLADTGLGVLASPFLGQLVQWMFFFWRRREGVLGLLISWFRSTSPPTPLIQLNNTWYPQKRMVTSAMVDRPDQLPLHPDVNYCRRSC